MYWYIFINKDGILNNAEDLQELQMSELVDWARLKHVNLGMGSVILGLGVLDWKELRYFVGLNCLVWKSSC